MANKKQAVAVPAKRSGGRPTRERADLLPDHILDAAQSLFFTHGYGGTSIEAIAAKAEISKRTFYTKFADKAAVFESVVRRLIGRFKPDDMNALFNGSEVETVLFRIAEMMLRAALTPPSLALHRLIIAESSRFPELAKAVAEEGTRQEALRRIAMLLKRREGKVLNPYFAAEQFMTLVIAIPQKRALEKGVGMTPKDIKTWSRQSVDLFLRGCYDG